MLARWPLFPTFDFHLWSLDVTTVNRLCKTNGRQDFLHKVYVQRKAEPCVHSVTPPCALRREGGRSRWVHYLLARSDTVHSHKAACVYGGRGGWKWREVHKVITPDYWLPLAFWKYSLRKKNLNIKYQITVKLQFKDPHIYTKVVFFCVCVSFYFLLSSGAASNYIYMNF